MSLCRLIPFIPFAAQLGAAGRKDTMSEHHCPSHSLLYEERRESESQRY
jgi:hypothetical protein